MRIKLGKGGEQMPAGDDPVSSGNGGNAQAPMGRGIRRLGDFHQDCRILDPQAFAARHGAFLLHHGPIAKLQLAGRGDRFSGDPETTPHGSIRNTMSTEGDTTASERTVDFGANYLVFPVPRADPQRSEDDLVWLGRSEDNDVIIPGATISAVHAFLKREGPGDYTLQDMHSKNGSFVNDEPVPAQGMGQAVRLKDGDRVRLGSVRMTFLGAAAFRALVLALLEDKI
ncbi:MAG: FHA domain-containing protein [Deltaproteobacteria bacterium]|nr:FHA domain-containing protein [Deltaproteobacteria bacterium]